VVTGVSAGEVVFSSAAGSGEAVPLTARNGDMPYRTLGAHGEADMEIPIIFITGHGDIPMTVQAMKAGAVEFLTKPFREEELLNALKPALKHS